MLLWYVLYVALFIAFVAASFAEGMVVGNAASETDDYRQ